MSTPLRVSVSPNKQMKTGWDRSPFQPLESVFGGNLEAITQGMCMVPCACPPQQGEDGRLVGHWHDWSRVSDLSTGEQTSNNKTLGGQKDVRGVSPNWGHQTGGQEGTTRACFAEGSFGKQTLL